MPARRLTNNYKGPGVTHHSLLPPFAALVFTPHLTAGRTIHLLTLLQLHHNILSACYTSYIYICIHAILLLIVVLWIVWSSVASGASKAVKTDRMLSISPINLQCQQSKVENSNEKMEALWAWLSLVLECKLRTNIPFKNRQLTTT